MAESSVIRIPQNVASEVRQTDANPNPTNAGTPSCSAAAVDKTMSSAANLVKLLPSGTVFAFQALSSSLTNRGHCYPSNKYLTLALVTLSALSCAAFSFTDTLIGSDGKLYYGVATPRGFYVFNFDGLDGDRGSVLRDLRRFRIRILDCLHAVFGVVVFLTIALGDSDVQSCFFPEAGANSSQLLANLPLGAAFLSSIVFMIFPTSRKGIGYSDPGPHSS